MKLTSTVCVVIALCVFYAQVREATQNDVKYIDMMWYNIDRGLYNNISGPVLEQVLDVYAPVSEAVENQVCREHSKFYKQGVKDKEVWALYKLLNGFLTHAEEMSMAGKYSRTGFRKFLMCSTMQLFTSL